MMQELVSRASARRQPTLGIAASFKVGLVRLLEGLGIKRPSFAEKVEQHKRGGPTTRRARQQALRCAKDLSGARSRLLRFVQRVSNAGFDISVTFRPVRYKVGTDNKRRKFGFAEMEAAITLATRTPAGPELTSLPIIITASDKEVSILPNFAELHSIGRKNRMTALFLSIAESLGSADERKFCERLEDALARAVASGRIIG